MRTQQANAIGVNCFPHAVQMLLPKPIKDRWACEAFTQVCIAEHL